MSTKESGIAPSKTPAGQMYLQKYGLPIPNSFTTRTGKIITATTSIKYFMYLNGFNFFVENFLHGILCKISWIKPNGHKNPQTNLPTITPTKIKNPLIRRIPRELTGDWKKYLVVSLFLILMIGFVSGMYVANESMMTAADEGVGRYKLEDGHFELKKKADETLLDAIKTGDKADVRQYYIDEAKKKLKKSSKKNLMRSLKQNLGKNLMQSSSQNLMFLLMHR